MFKLSRRLSIIRASLIGCLVVAVLSTAGYFIINHKDTTNAATANGEIVKVRYEDGDEHVIWYGTANGTYSSQTRAYEVINHLNSNGNSTSSSEYFSALCAQPSQDNPAKATYEAVLMNGSTTNPLDEVVNPIKFMMWIWLYGNSNIRSQIFGSVDNNSSWGRGDSEGTATENRRLTFTHAVVGYLYRQSEDDRGLSVAEKEQVIQTISRLRNLIDEEVPAWQTAKNYKLFRTKATSDTTGESGQQDVVWIERPDGGITVLKCDADLSVSPCVPQGDASFDGTTFELWDGSTKVDTKTLSNGANSLTFTGLDPGKNYTIKETSSNTAYTVSPTTQSNIQPTSGGATNVRFDNYIKKGKLIVNKKDKDAGECPTITNGLSLAGITFNLYNRSTNSVFYGGAAKTPGSLVASRTLADNNSCSVSFEDLPYGQYDLVEVIPDSLKGWVKDESPRRITIHPSNSGEIITYNFENQPIRGDIVFTKKDTTNGTPMANAVFEISSISNNYTENHIVVADANGVVDTRDSVNPHTNHTNGYDELYYASEAPIAYAGYGTWFGLKNNGTAISPKNDVGALPYGTYLIQELKCDTNMFCSNLGNEKKTFSITTNGQIVYLNDDGTENGTWGNDCAEFSVSTTATDNADGDKYIEAGKDTVIKDTINYCAKSGYTYTITGTLMDQSAHEPLLINGEPVTQTITIPSDADDCGRVEMLFPVNTSDLAGKSIVVFEKLYYKNEVKASHEEFDSPAQTVDVVSLGTIAVDNADEDKFIELGEETKIKDTVSYCAKKGIPYKITGVLIDKTTSQPIIIDGEQVTASVEFTPEEDCGTVEMLFPIDTSKISAHPIVVYEKLFKVIPGEPDTYEPVISHEDPKDEDQTVYVISISTTVQPDEDGDKVFPRDSDVTVTDKVHYCLKPGIEYTVKGVVMDKSTGNGLLVDSKLVEQSVTFTPTEACGELDMLYTFNTKGLGGAKLVIFESLYQNDKLLIEHKDIENELESFEIDINAPDTGYITKHSADNQGSSHQELLIISAFAIAPVIIYTVNRFKARKHFLNK